MIKLRTWTFHKLISLATKINPFSVVVCNYPKDNLLHEFTLVFRVSAKGGKPFTDPKIEAYYDGVKL